jgi:hypothetical protein
MNKVKIKLLVGSAATAMALSFVPAAIPSAGAASTITICPAYGDGTGASGGSTKIDIVGEHKVVTVTAPEGYLISGYCVKAGTLTTFVTVDPPQESVQITSPNGKGVSHYSVIYVPDGGGSSS